MTIKEVSEKYHISAKVPPAGILCAQRAFRFSCGYCTWVLISTARPPKFS